MSNINRKIEELAREERRNTIYGVFAVILVVVSLLFVVFPPMGTTNEITGKVLRLHGKPTDEGTELYLIVKLNDGSEVMSHISDSRFFKKDQKVKLLKREPLVFGRVIYTFQGYDNE